MLIPDMLHRRLEAANIPIYGVSVPDESNKATWRIDFRPEATAQQRSDAQAIITAFVIDTPIMQYIRLHHTHRLTFAKALYALDNGIGAHAVGGDALVTLRSALTDCAAVVATLPPAFTTHIAKLRDVYGVNGAIASMTIANCRILAQIVREWLNSRLATANEIEDALE